MSSCVVKFRAVSHCHCKAKGASDYISASKWDIPCSPYKLRRLMRADMAGVAKMASLPTRTCTTERLFSSSHAKKSDQLAHKSSLASIKGRMAGADVSRDSKPTFLIPAPAASLRIICTASLLKYLPSPPRPMVVPLTSSPKELNRD